MSENNSVVSKLNLGFDKANISKNDYVSTLSMEAYKVGYFDDTTLEKIQSGMLHSLGELIALGSESKSTSVSKDTAADYGKSIMFNVNTYLISMNDDELAAEALKTRSFYELYARGYLINKGLYDEAKRLYNEVKYTRLANGSAVYNRTIDVIMYNYLSSYDPKLAAHEKLYVSMKKYGFSGAYSIGQTVLFEKELIKLGNGGHDNNNTIEIK